MDLLECTLLHFDIIKFRVYAATWQKLQVAVKLCSKLEESKVKEFFKEAKVMMYF